MCTQLGFNTPFSAPYAHHMFGKAEHLWRTLRDCASVMLHAMYVPSITSSCAIITVVHLRNCTFRRAVGSCGGVPITLLTCVVPYESTFRVFGCAVFAKVPENLRRKVCLKAFRGVMVGYSQNSPGYRVYSPATKRITTFVHIMLHENVPVRSMSRYVISSINVFLTQTMTRPPMSHPRLMIMTLLIHRVRLTLCMRQIDLIVFAGHLLTSYVRVSLTRARLASLKTRRTSWHSHASP
jgi:hypothetical protein